MSGQPYKYYTDVEKYRNEYLDSLNLRVNIDDMNLQANKNYKETGALPAVSQMKDNRTTSEILADTEKLKIDLIDTLSKISNPQFASAVVQYIMKSPINQDNSLLIFTAQRINDIMEKLKRIYTYGIKGDQNDVQQFVNFVISMYNDKNAIASSTKDFLSKYGTGKLGQFSGTRSDVYTETKNILLDISNKLNLMTLNIRSEYNSIINRNPDIRDNVEDTINTLMTINGMITEGIVPLLPTQQLIERIDKILNDALADENFNLNEWQQGENETILVKYKEYINTSLPTVTYLNLTINKLELYYTEYFKYLQSLSTSLYENQYDEHGRRRREIPLTPEQVRVYNINTEKFYKSIENFAHTLTPNESYADTDIMIFANEVKQAMRNLTEYMNEDESIYTEEEESKSDIYRPPVRPPDNTEQPIVQPPTPATVLGNQLLNLIRDNLPPQAIEYYTPQINEAIQNQDIEQLNRIRHNIDTVLSQRERTGQPVMRRNIEREVNELADRLREAVHNNITDQETINYYSRVINQSRQDPTEDKLNRLQYMLDAFNQERNRGNGIHKPGKRGRPKGSGIQRKYADTVKKAISNDGGVSEDMRFIKFGKYLINNKKLNDGILAVKRPSGNNIMEFPSRRISSNMQSVIKTMIGGGMPKYEQLECLSEPEKAYLHKLSTKANIVDKFSIPAPSKSQYEKDIHDFEVMKGEILSGNDNKDLIKRFKLHIMKLSKMGSLPKRDVSDLLEMLIDLGY